MRARIRADEGGSQVSPDEDPGKDQRRHVPQKRRDRRLPVRPRHRGHLSGKPAEAQLQLPPHGRPGAGKGLQGKRLPRPAGRENHEVGPRHGRFGNFAPDERDLLGQGAPQRLLHVLFRALVEERDDGPLAPEKVGRGEPRPAGSHHECVFPAERLHVTESSAC